MADEEPQPKSTSIAVRPAAISKIYRQDKIPFVVEEVFYPFQESRYDEYSQQKPEYKEETEFQYGEKHLAAQILP